MAGEELTLHVPSPPTAPSAGASSAEIERFGRECIAIGIYNERAAVLTELDALARFFEGTGKPNTARKIRDMMDAIDARLRENAPAPFAGPPGAPT